MRRLGYCSVAPLYLPGGYPELHLHTLQDNHAMIESPRAPSTPAANPSTPNAAA